MRAIANKYPEIKSSMWELFTISGGRRNVEINHENCNGSSSTLVNLELISTWIKLNPPNKGDGWDW